jgi:hypothetical protein
MNAYWIRAVLACGIVALCAGCMGPEVTDTVVKPTITSTTAKRISASEDPFNNAMLSNLTPGLIAVVHVTPAKIELVQAYIMLTPNFTQHAEGRGDRIVATLSAEGKTISETVVSDPTVAIEENLDGRAPHSGRMIRAEERRVAVSLPLFHRVDTFDVTVGATGQRASFDVSRLFEAYCAEAPQVASCKATSGDRSSR